MRLFRCVPVLTVAMMLAFAMPGAAEDIPTDPEPAVVAMSDGGNGAELMVAFMQAPTATSGAVLYDQVYPPPSMTRYVVRASSTFEVADEFIVPAGGWTINYIGAVILVTESAPFRYTFYGQSMSGGPGAVVAQRTVTPSLTDFAIADLSADPVILPGGVYYLGITAATGTNSEVSYGITPIAYILRPVYRSSPSAQWVRWSSSVAGGLVFGLYTRVATPSPVTSFLSPLEGDGVTNVVRAGATVPVRFTFGWFDDPAAPVDDPAFIEGVYVRVRACEAGSPLDWVEFTTTGATELRFDPGNGQWVLNWRIPKNLAGKCGGLYLETFPHTFGLVRFAFK